MVTLLRGSVYTVSFSLSVANVSDCDDAGIHEGEDAIAHSSNLNPVCGLNGRYVNIKGF